MEQESSTFKETPVVIMSSENVLPRIDRYHFVWVFSVELVKEKVVKKILNFKKLCRCLEEGAEDFIVKPVKLSDVKRLKDYMATKEAKVEGQDREGIHKRKLLDASDVSSSSPPSTSSSSLPPSSPSVIDSPIRRLKMTSTDWYIYIYIYSEISVFLFLFL